MEAGLCCSPILLSDSRTWLYHTYRDSSGKACALEILIYLSLFLLSPYSLSSPPCFPLTLSLFLSFPLSLSPSFCLSLFLPLYLAGMLAALIGKRNITSEESMSTNISPSGYIKPFICFPFQLHYSQPPGRVSRAHLSLQPLLCCLKAYRYTAQAHTALTLIHH